MEEETSKEQNSTKSVRLDGQVGHHHGEAWMEQERGPKTENPRAREEPRQKPSERNGKEKPVVRSVNHSA